MAWAYRNSPARPDAPADYHSARGDYRTQQTYRNAPARPMAPPTTGGGGGLSFGGAAHVPLANLAPPMPELISSRTNNADGSWSSESRWVPQPGDPTVWHDAPGLAPGAAGPIWRDAPGLQAGAQWGGQPGAQWGGQPGQNTTQPVGAPVRYQGPTAATPSMARESAYGRGSFAALTGGRRF